MCSGVNSRGLTPSGHSKFSDTLVLCFWGNSWYTSLTKFQPTSLGNPVLCSGPNTSFGFWVIKNPTLGTHSPKNSTSISTYVDNGVTVLAQLPTHSFGTLQNQPKCRSLSNPLENQSALGWVWVGNLKPLHVYINTSHLIITSHTSLQTSSSTLHQAMQYL